MCITTSKLTMLMGLLLFILCMCGYTRATSTCESYDIAQNASVVTTWKLLTGDDTFTRISHTSEVIHATSSSAATADRLVIIGGIEYESAQPVVDYPVLVYQLHSNTFITPVDSILSSLSTVKASTKTDSVFVSPASRSEHASFIDARNTIFVFGGQNKEFLNDLWRLCIDDSSSTATWDQLVAPTDTVTLAAMPVPRIGHSFTQIYENATTIGSVVFGGLSESYIELSGVHLALIIKGGAANGGACSTRNPSVTWRILPTQSLTANGPIPRARAYHSTMVTSKLFTAATSVCLMVYGGKNVQVNVIFNELWRLCPPVNVTGTTSIEKQVHTWELLTPIGTTPGYRYGASMVFVNEGKLALAGGSYTFPNDFLSDSWELNSNATQWIRLQFDADFTPGRRGHTLSFVVTQETKTPLLLLFGGKDRYTVVEKRIEQALYVAPFCTTGRKIMLCETSGKYVCVPCAAGSYLQTATGTCLLCPHGTFSSAGAAECTKCPIGTYSSVLGKTSETQCESCPTGTFSNARGAISIAACTACAAGTFAASTGAASCTSCPIGTFSLAGAATCTRCAAGQWSASGAAACTPCTAGTYNPNNGASTCFQCPKGFYSNTSATECTACPMNTSSTIVGASYADCGSCPAYAFTTSVGQTQCRVCPFGSSLIAGSACRPCEAGYYASNATQGACMPCPKGSYASEQGSTTCLSCPQGTFTRTTGAKTQSECYRCDLGYFYDGITCQQCAMGSFAPSTGTCSKCSPGSYTTITGAITCLFCPPLTYNSQYGATGCSSCADDAVSMTGWHNCISCSTAFSSSLFLPGCVNGRNGVLCSGNGACVYGGCACENGWAGGDCSTSTNETLLSNAASVLYFPSEQNRLIRAPFTSSSSVPITVSVKVARAGSTASSLDTNIVWTTMTNFSSASSNLPLQVRFSAGERVKSINVVVTPQSGCRYFTIALQDLSNAIESAISIDSDRTVSFYFDDMNGFNGGQSNRAITVSYTRQTNIGTFVASVPLDRQVSTRVTLKPTSSGFGTSVYLRDQPLNVLVVIDPTASIASTFVKFLPAIVSKLQTAYPLLPHGVRMGLLIDNVATAAPPFIRFHGEITDFFSAAQSILAGASLQSSLNWQYLVENVLNGNTSAWPSTDRRFLLVVGNDQLISSFSTDNDDIIEELEQGLQTQGVFAFFLSTLATVLQGTNTAVMQSIVYNTNEAIAYKITEAFQVKDTTLPTAVNILEDPAEIVMSAQITGFTAASGASLPILSVILKAMPVLFVANTSDVVLSVPGVMQMLLQIQEPGHACILPVIPPPTTTLPTDSEIFSGWVDAWHIDSSVAEIQREWQHSSPTMEMQLHQDASLLRHTTSAVLSLVDSNSTTLALRKIFSGSHFSVGLWLVLRGYVRISTTELADEDITCQLAVTMVGVNNTLQVKVQTIDSAGGEWQYKWLRHVVPWELDHLEVTLECTTSTPGVIVEWSTLGLLPDPAFICKCPRGFYVDTASDSSDEYGECVRCPAGSYCAAGIKRACPDGTFSFGKASSCESCRNGWICVDGQARLCEAGTYVSSSSVTCEVCPAGFACRNGEKIACPAGMFSHEQARDCQSCPPGTISITESSATCQRCPIGSTSNYQRMSCVSCQAGEETTDSGQHPCSSCAMTSFPFRTQAEICVA